MLLLQITPVHSSFKLHDDKHGSLHLEGVASFVRIPALDTALQDAMAKTDHVTLEISELMFVDDACYDLIMTWRREMEAPSKTVEADWDRLKKLTREVPLLEVPSHRDRRALEAAAAEGSR